MPPKEEKANEDEEEQPLRTVEPVGNNFSNCWFKDKQICRVHVAAVLLARSLLLTHFVQFFAWAVIQGGKVTVKNRWKQVVSHALMG